MGRRRRPVKNANTYHHQNKSLIVPPKGEKPSFKEHLDPLDFRAAIGDDLYYRVMQWNDSGAVEALHAAEERRMAREKRKPCWVPKLKKDLFIGEVDWDKKDSRNICEVPQSAVALAEQLLHEEEETAAADVHQIEQGGHQSSPSALPSMVDELHAIKATGWGELDEPHVIKASGWGDLDEPHPIKPSGGGEVEDPHPIEPTGWGELDGEATVPLFSASVNSATLAEAVLEDSVDGQRLLVGGQPFQPSGWDQLDPSWPQLGWDPPRLHAGANLKSSWENPQCHDGNSCRLYQGNYREDDASVGQIPELVSETDPGWKDHRWYPGQHSPFQQGCYMTAF